jgi:2,3-bisphosphoglycerate-dependent phosphoglycerate mutase
MTVTRFIVVRHGETQWNVESRVQGQRDSALTIAGIAQAEAIALRLAGERFDVLVSSDLGRALETARRIAARCGHAIVREPRLRERRFGVGEGLTYDDIGREYPDAFSRTRETDPDFVIPGGESRRAFHERVTAAFEALEREHAGRSVAVVTHGGVLATLYRFIHGIAVATPHKVPITNASFNLVACDAGRWSVETWDDSAHLEAADPFEED